MIKTKTELEKYISELREALKLPGPRSYYFPSDPEKRKLMNESFARDLGFGLKDFSPEDVKAILGALYGQFIVSNSLDTCGVRIDAKEFISHLNLPSQFSGSSPS